MRKEKGFALVLAVTVIAFLAVLASIVVSLAATSYIKTKQLEQDNKLKLAAESGIEKGNLILRNYILNNASILNDPTTFNPSEINNDTNIKDDLKYSLDNIGVTVSFSPNTAASDSVDNPLTYSDVTTGRSLDYIRITSVATNTKNRKKTVSIVLDKKGINNLYFNKLFHGSLTTAGSLSEAGSTFTVDNNTNLYCAGDMFLQANSVVLSPAAFEMDSDSISVKTNTFTVGPNPVSGSGNKINLYKDAGNTIITGWKNTSIREIKMLNIIPQQTENKADKEQDWDDEISKGNDPLNNLDSNIYINQNYKPGTTDLYTDPTTGNPLPPTLATYKAKKLNNNPDGPIDFRKLVDGGDFKADNNGIYFSIINSLKITYPTNYIDMYGTFYKLVLIDGDLTIPDDPDENFNNYIIYCTGKVTFEGEAHFFNSSLFAKQIQFDGGTPAKNVEFYGVRTNKALDHIVGGAQLKDFGVIEKARINYYLINNLESYGDYIQYKTLEWKEK